MSDLFVLAAMSPMATTGLVAVFLAICIAMILIVLIQRPQGGGLSGAFGAGGGGGGGGGAGAGQTAFGTKTGDVLTMATIGIFVLFVVFAVWLNFATRPPEPKDNTPTIVAPGTPRETVDDEADASAETSEGDPAVILSDELADEAEAAIEDGVDAVQDAADELIKEVEEALPGTTPSADPSDD